MLSTNRAGWLIAQGVIESKVPVHKIQMADRFDISNIVLRNTQAQFANELWMHYMDAAVYNASTDTGVGSGDAFLMEGISIMKIGGFRHLRLESSVTDTVRPMTTDELHTFQSNAPQNARAIVWAVSGIYGMLRKGYMLSSYGVLILRYPRLTKKIISDESFLDIPDGILTNLCILGVALQIQKRFSVPEQRFTDEIGTLVAQYYKSLGLDKMDETIKTVTTALT